ncbi:unnamed protein product [Prunus armeniaca]
MESLDQAEQVLQCNSSSVIIKSNHFCPFQTEEASILPIQKAFKGLKLIKALPNSNSWFSLFELCKSPHQSEARKELTWEIPHPNSQSLWHARTLKKVDLLTSQWFSRQWGTLPYYHRNKHKTGEQEQLDSKAHVAVTATSVADITTGHGHLTTTPSSILTAVSSTPTPPPPSNFGKAFHALDTRDTGWIINSGATDHMTYNSALFFTTISPHRDHVMNANNAAALVTGVDSILLAHALPLDKDIQSREIFGRGTKREGGLYYVDDVATSRVLCAGSAETS